MIAMMVQLKDTSGTIVLFETIGGQPKSNHQQRESLKPVSTIVCKQVCLSGFCASVTAVTTTEDFGSVARIRHSRETHVVESAL